MFKLLSFYIYDRNDYDNYRSANPQYGGLSVQQFVLQTDLDDYCDKPYENERQHFTESK